MLRLTLPLNYLVSIPEENLNFHDILIVNIVFKRDIIHVVLQIRNERTLKTRAPRFYAWTVMLCHKQRVLACGKA